MQRVFEILRHGLGILFIVAGLGLVLSGLVPGIPTLAGFAPDQYTISIPLLKDNNRVYQLHAK